MPRQASRRGRTANPPASMARPAMALVTDSGFLARAMVSLGGWLRCSGGTSGLARAPPPRAALVGRGHGRPAPAALLPPVRCCRGAHGPTGRPKLSCGSPPHRSVSSGRLGRWCHGQARRAGDAAPQGGGVAAKLPHPHHAHRAETLACHAGPRGRQRGRGRYLPNSRAGERGKPSLARVPLRPSGADVPGQGRRAGAPRRSACRRSAPRPRRALPGLGGRKRSPARTTCAGPSPPPPSPSRCPWPDQPPPPPPPRSRHRRPVPSRTSADHPFTTLTWGIACLARQRSTP